MLNFLSKFYKNNNQRVDVVLGLTKDRMYFDYASITPVDERVIKHISKISKEYPANPNSLYKEGFLAFKELEKSRETVAKHLDVHADEIIFTSGGTESNNLAIQGVLKAYKSNPNFPKPHIISSEIEHPAVRELLLQYQEAGECDVTFIPVGVDGIVDLKEFKKALRPETILVTIMYVNNEIGTIQPISEISKIVRHYKKAKLEKVIEENKKPMTYSSIYPLVHTDACQAVLFCPMRAINLGVDMITLDSAKFYGPRGVGALYIKRSVTQSKAILPVQIGGSQEFELRAGTQNVAGISGFAYALDLATAEKEKESMRLALLRDFVVEELKKVSDNKKEASEITPKIIFNGTYGKDSYGNDLRVPNNINICILGIDAEYAVLRLDVRGVCVSSVTSCRSKNEDSTSYVVEALYKNVNGETEATFDCGKSSLRITLGRFTTESEVRKLVKVLIEVLGK